MPKFAYGAGIFKVQHVLIIFCDINRGNIKIIPTCEADAINDGTFCTLKDYQENQPSKGE